MVNQKVKHIAEFQTDQGRQGGLNADSVQRNPSRSIHQLLQSIVLIFKSFQNRSRHQRLCGGHHRCCFHGSRAPGENHLREVDSQPTRFEISISGKSLMLQRPSDLGKVKISVSIQVFETFECIPRAFSRAYHKLGRFPGANLIELLPVLFVAFNDECQPFKRGHTRGFMQNSRPDTWRNLI